MRTLPAEGPAAAPGAARERTPPAPTLARRVHDYALAIGADDVALTHRFEQTRDAFAGLGRAVHAAPGLSLSWSMAFLSRHELGDAIAQRNEALAARLLRDHLDVMRMLEAGCVKPNAAH